MSYLMDMSMSCFHMATKVEYAIHLSANVGGKEIMTSGYVHAEIPTCKAPTVEEASKASPLRKICLFGPYKTNSLSA